MKTFKKHELELAVLDLLGLKGKMVTSLVLRLGTEEAPSIELTYLPMDAHETDEDREIIEATRLGDAERCWVKTEDEPSVAEVFEMYQELGGKHEDSIGVQIRRGEVL